MLASIGILIVAAIAILIDYPTRSRNGSKREATIFVILLALSTLIGVLLALHVKVPSPLNILAAIYRPITNLISSILQG